MTTPDLSLTEWVVLALLAENPSHGFAVARQLRAEADLGRILTVHRPLVYRALDRLVKTGLAEPTQVEPGNAGPSRTIHRPTDCGHLALRGWFAQPVEHVRDLRIELLVKVRLVERLGNDATELVLAQLTALAPTFDRLVDGDECGDVVDLWRHHSADAARRFLNELAAAAVSGREQAGR